MIDVDAQTVLRALAQGVGVLLVSGLGSVATRRILGPFAPEERVQLLSRVVFWGVLGLGIATIARGLGFDITVLLGAAGVLTVALGFASQTSASNVISGLFLIGERPFSVGDVVRIGATTGEVVAIDLLSTKLRTMDNLFVRVPNESVMKAEITNLTRFPIRRIDLAIEVAYDTDLDRAERALLERCATLDFVLDEPAPFVAFTSFNASGVSLQFSAWAQTQGFMASKRKLANATLKALRDAGIEVPFPHTVLISKPAPGAVPQPHSDPE